MKLSELGIGQTADILHVGGTGHLRQHFLDMGIIPGNNITLVKYAPLGDPIEFRIHSYELTLRIEEANQIEVQNERYEEQKHKQTTIKDSIAHPGLGEEGKYHVKSNENPLPDTEVLSFALVGNQNCGKTTLFNQLTGSNQHVGNFPGVTVDEKSGIIKNIQNTKITDLPGIYSMSPYTQEEIVSREFILNEKPKGIINIIDATNIERNLYLTMQLLELDIPMVLAINMMDELRGNGGSILINEMENNLGVPVVPISASKNEGITELVDHAIHIAKYQEQPGRQDFCDEKDHNGAIHRCLHAIMSLIEDHANDAQIPLRFAATKLVEGDERVEHALSLDINEKEMIEHIVLQMEKECGLDRSAAIADMRFKFIEKLVSQTVIKPKESKEHVRSAKIDKILTGKYTAIPSFIAIMALVFWLTFDVVGGTLQKLLDIAITKLGVLLDSLFIQWGVNEVVHSLVINGIFVGVGTVLSFLPIIIVLFFFLSLLEDTGYLARVAFFMDKLLRKIGLSGRSIVPMLIGFGCTVPAVMSSRTLPSARDRKMTILMTPFMSCSAKLPIYAFFVSHFFPNYKALIMIALYLLGIILGILFALISKKFVFKGEAVPFVMELPNYRLPDAKSVGMLLWDKAKDFLQRAFSIIFISTIIIWFLQSFTFSMTFITQDTLVDQSILAKLSNFISPILAPIGLGKWQIVVALISGFLAKESVVSTLEILSSGSILTFISPLSALSLLVFSLLYTPCVAAIFSIKKELGNKYSSLVVLLQCIIAWLMSFIVYSIGGLFV